MFDGCASHFSILYYHGTNEIYTIVVLIFMKCLHQNNFLSDMLCLVGISIEKHVPIRSILYNSPVTSFLSWFLLFGNTLIYTE